MKIRFHPRQAFFAATLLVVGCATPIPTGHTPNERGPTAPQQQAPILPADLPPDADRSDVDRQLALLARGLYLTKVGEVRALPANYAKASWAGGDKAPSGERADLQTDERIKILLDERQPE